MSALGGYHAPELVPAPPRPLTGEDGTGVWAGVGAGVEARAVPKVVSSLPRWT